MWIAGVIVFLGWIVSVCLHEFGHAIVAYYGGDTSVKDKGYLTLNPLKYTDPATSLLFPLIFLLMGGIALPGGAVYINHQKLRNRVWQSAVSLAGPAVNLLCAGLIALYLQGQSAVASLDWFAASFAFLALLQISAVLINLLPIPPLDGYGLIEPWLPGPWQQVGAKVSRYGFWVLLGLFWFVPPFQAAFWQQTFAIAALLGIPAPSIRVGAYLFNEPVTKLILILALLGGLWYLKRSGQTTWYPNTPQASSCSRQRARGVAKSGQSNLRGAGGFQHLGDTKLRKKLMTLVKNREDMAEGLISTEKLKNPGHSERWYLEKVIYDLQRDHL